MILRVFFLIHMPIKSMIGKGKRSKTRVSTAKTEKLIRNPEWLHQRSLELAQRRTNTQKQDALIGWSPIIGNNISAQREIKHRSNKRALVLLLFRNPQMQRLQLRF